MSTSLMIAELWLYVTGERERPPQYILPEHPTPTQEDQALGRNEAILVFREKQLAAVARIYLMCSPEVKQAIKVSKPNGNTNSSDNLESRNSSGWLPTPLWNWLEDTYTLGPKGLPESIF
ncbi:MAG: hypothetical protein L6R39_001148 [Caloplaca ligustica]|nr:MAG: hypothetical protein L6R39_001148 [Caloplaca ligustica]